MNNIILIGMPGSGKSTIGVVLAKILGYEFIDSDLEIQKKEKRRLSEIIASEGSKRFLEIENEVNASLNLKNTVIATGGSAIYGTSAMEHLGKSGTVVYLRLEYQNLEKRLGNLKNRGVVLRKGQTLLDLYKERTPLYEKYADIIIDEKDMDIQQIALTIQEILLK